MNCLAYERVARIFKGWPSLDVVACARAISRGHASHAIELRAVKVPQTEAGRQSRKIRRAVELDQFWAAIALQFAVHDLIEEHDGAISKSLTSNLLRFAEHQTRDIVDPAGISHSQFLTSQLLPPYHHLPSIVPSALSELFDPGVGFAAAQPIDQQKNKQGTNSVPCPSADAPTPARRRVRPSLLTH